MSTSQKYDFFSQSTTNRIPNSKSRTYQLCWISIISFVLDFSHWTGHPETSAVHLTNISRCNLTQWSDFVLSGCVKSSSSDCNVMITLGSRKREYFVYPDFAIWKYSEGSPNPPTWLVFPSICFNTNDRGVEITILAISSVFCSPIAKYINPGAIVLMHLARVESCGSSYSIVSTRKSITWSHGGGHAKTLPMV